MTAPRGSRLLLRLYPRAWRERYGDELESLLADCGARGGAWRMRLDLIAGATRERARALGLTAVADDPGERMRDSILLVLWAWILFVAAGLSLQRLSERWRAAAPSGGRTPPAVAFDVLVAGAVAGTLLVLVGIALALPSLVRFLRDGGWPAIRRRILEAVCLSAAALGAIVALSLWARHLSAAQRDGRDLAYELAFTGAAALVVACLGAWGVAATTAARRVRLDATRLRGESLLAAGAAASMTLMAGAAIVWRSGVARVSPLATVDIAVMLLATALALLGARRALATR